MAELQVELVAADRKVWSGAASVVTAKTTEGEMGIMPGHSPVLASLVTGPVRIRTLEGQVHHAAVHGGFLSVSENVVAILAETAELAEEIDVTRAEQALERARQASAEDAAARAAELRAETRLRTADRR